MIFTYYPKLNGMNLLPRLGRLAKLQVLSDSMHLSPTVSPTTKKVEIYQLNPMYPVSHLICIGEKYHPIKLGMPLAPAETMRM